MPSPPKCDGRTDLGEQLRQARLERGRPRARHRQPHPQVVVEQRQYVQEPGRRGDVGDDEEHPLDTPPSRRPLV
ncbi:MAG: hypothetical protein HOV70_06750 [Streptomyces sp.]|nr:hypothetical protein [Streptomyces sp.]NUS75885.1 hypothetical protein [Streptomyces sp.]